MARTLSLIRTLAHFHTWNQESLCFSILKSTR